MSQIKSKPGAFKLGIDWQKTMTSALPIIGDYLELDCTKNQSLLIDVVTQFLNFSKSLGYELSSSKKRSVMAYVQATNKEDYYSKQDDCRTNIQQQAMKWLSVIGADLQCQKDFQILNLRYGQMAILEDRVQILELIKVFYEQRYQYNKSLYVDYINRFRSLIAEVQSLQNYTVSEQEQHLGVLYLYPSVKEEVLMGYWKRLSLFTPSNHYFSSTEEQDDFEAKFHKAQTKIVSLLQQYFTCKHAELTMHEDPNCDQDQSWEDITPCG